MKQLLFFWLGFIMISITPTPSFAQGSLAGPLVKTAAGTGLEAVVNTGTRVAVSGGVGTAIGTRALQGALHSGVQGMIPLSPVGNIAPINRIQPGQAPRLTPKASVLSSEKGKPIVLPSQVKSFSRADISAILRERVYKTYDDALATQRRYSYLFQEGRPLFRVGPATRKLPIVLAQGKYIYPNAPFLQGHPFDLAKQYVANENRHIIRLAPQLDALETEMYNNISNFNASQWWYAGDPHKDMKYLAREIPANTSYLLVGNHDFMEIYQNRGMNAKIASLLDEIRLRQPNREIILLSEEYYYDPITDDSDPLVQAIQHNNISFIDLHGKMAKALPDPVMECYDAADEAYTSHSERFHTLEDMRLNTVASTSIIKKLRLEHPDALFIVYDNARRIRGYEPFSLGAALRGPNTFTISFVDESVYTWFDIATRYEFNSVGILHFDKPELSRLFGTDIQVRVPYTPSPRATKMSITFD